MKHTLLFLILILSVSIKGQNSADNEFLTQLATDTWHCLDAMIDETTGFPQDTQSPGGHTNTTNIGLYLASLCVATKTGLSSDQHAYARAEKILTSLESFDRMHGFMPHIIDVQLKSRKAHGIVAISDFNKLVVGLIMVRQVWPQLQTRIDTFIGAIEWHRLYNKDTGQVSWGYDFDNDTVTGWGSLWLAADTRSAAFLMIANDAAPANIWPKMEKNLKRTAYGNILTGYGMGGLFMMAMDSIFLPEITTEIGESSGNLAWQQIRFSKKRGYPFWGWSNSYMPGSGYTEGGHLSENVITPHAIALMIEHYPKHAISALRGLVDTGGTQGPKGYENKNWGLRDAYDMKKKQWDDHYLSLDQGMLFLAISNYLHQGLVRNIYAADPLVQKGLDLVSPYMKEDPSLLDLWAKRDSTQDQPILLQEKGDNIEIPLNQINFRAKPFIQVSAKNINKTPQINVDTQANDQPIAINFKLPKVNLRGLKALEIDIDVLQASQKNIGSLRLLIIDQHDQKRYAHFELKKDQKTYRIDSDQLLGIHIQEENIKSLELIFWTNPWYYQEHKLKAKQLSLQLSKVRFWTDFDKKMNILEATEINHAHLLTQ
ncbi:glucoamylase family protein [Lentisphaera profundi]|uniref:Glucoamylase family protein n=1 Tax=Lentisphaera profundi TaxID=1658616 RepID=A0ABY7VXG6_9BACT|nr:glucoamylase family protein [Lentisphaera profundi]WDE98611.1 glucoamylase family protein [Lentisphaera profundi]